MKGVVLAAGKGTRLYPITRTIAKPLLPLANRPTLHYAFDRLKEIGITRICVVVGENESAMRNALGDGAQLGIHLDYATQKEPKGLAHALECAKPFVGDEPFVMYLGDAIYSKPLTDMAQRFIASDCANLNLVMEVDDPERFGVAKVDGERIVRLVEKPKEPESNLAMAGVYFFRKHIWDVLPNLEPSARGEYEITDAIQLLVDKEALVLAGVYEGEWFDTGTLDSFLACSAFLIGNGTLLGAGSTVNAQCGTAVCIGENCFVECAFLEDCVILPNTTVRCNGRITHSILGGHVQADADVIGKIVFEPA